MTLRPLFRLVFVAAPLAMPAGALAQERDPFAPRPPSPLLRDDVADTRTIPGYAAPGLRMGALTIAPQLAALTDFDSNVLSRTANKQGDVAFTVAPAVTASGEIGRTHLALGASGSAVRHARLTGQNHETFALDAKGALSLSSALELGVAAGWARKAEPNYTVGAASTEGSATLFQQLQGTVGLAANLGILRLLARADLDRFDYLPVRRPDGSLADQSFRDQRALTMTLQAERALPGGRMLFTSASLRRGDSLHPSLCCDRTARGGEVLAGLRGELTHLINAEISVGYQWRGYRTAAYRDYRGGAFRARVEWYPTPLISTALTVRRDIVDSGLPTSAGVVVDSFQLRTVYEVKRNLNLVATAGFTHEKYRDDVTAGPSARAVSAGVEARLALSNRYLVGAFARYRNRSSSSTLLPRLGGAVSGGLSLRLSL